MKTTYELSGKTENRQAAVRAWLLLQGLKLEDVGKMFNPPVKKARVSQILMRQLQVNQDHVDQLRKMGMPEDLLPKVTPRYPRYSNGFCLP